MKSQQSEKSRTHQERFRCPQCGRMVTVTAGFRRDEQKTDTLVRFECTMEGMCGSPVWDPCPMYMAYMERAPKPAAPGPSSPDDVKEAW